MEIQIILGYGIGLAALIYAVRIFTKQFKTPDVDPKCDDCPTPKAKEKDNN